MSIHAQKHVYNPEVKSTKNKTQFGENIDVAKLREDTLLHPDQVIYDSEHKFLNANEINDILDEFYDYFGYDIVPIAEVEYEDFICLDFRVNKQNPEIVYWNYELALENPIEGITLLYSSMDDLMGLYYLRARYYNTGIGRFTQEDVIYNDGLNLSVCLL